jgi:hypothetical protein
VTVRPDWSILKPPTSACSDAHYFIKLPPTSINFLALNRDGLLDLLFDGGGGQHVGVWKYNGFTGSLAGPARGPAVGT